MHWAVKRFVFPMWSEYDLAHLVMLVVLLPLFFPEFISDLKSFAASDGRSLILLVLVAAGLCCAAYVAFIHRGAPSADVLGFMMFGTAVIYGGIGVFAGYHGLENIERPTITGAITFLLSLLTFLRGVVLLVLVRIKYDIESHFLRGDARIQGIAFGAGVIILALWTATLVGVPHWSLAAASVLSLSGAVTGFETHFADGTDTTTTFK